MSAAQYCSDMPDVFPGTCGADRYTGQFLRRLRRLMTMLEDMSSSVSDEGRAALNGWWAHGSDATFGEMQAGIPGPARIDDEHCESMDRIREHRDHFTTRYAGTVYDYLDLIDAIGRVEEMIAYLEEGGMERCRRNRPGTCAVPSEDVRRRVYIADALEECTPYSDGWYRLADVGSALLRGGRRIDHLSAECERLGFEVLKGPGGGFLGSSEVYIRPGPSSSAIADRGRSGMRTGRPASDGAARWFIRPSRGRSSAVCSSCRNRPYPPRLCRGRSSRCTSPSDPDSAPHRMPAR